jgi:hypothetical protein
MKSVQSVTHTGGGQDSRYYIDGKRVSFETFDSLRSAAFMFGMMDCFLTKAHPVDGHRTRRVNYSRIQVPEYTLKQILGT